MSRVNQNRKEALVSIMFSSCEIWKLFALTTIYHELQYLGIPWIKLLFYLEAGILFVIQKKISIFIYAK